MLLITSEAIAQYLNQLHSQIKKVFSRKHLSALWLILLLSLICANAMILNSTNVYASSTISPDKNYLKRVSFKKKNTLLEGTIIKFRVKKAKSFKGKIRWTSSNPSIVKVLDKKGTVTTLKARKAGKAIITCRINGYPKCVLKSKITVRKKINITSLTFQKSTIDLYIGDTAKTQLNILPENATNKTVQYRSSNPGSVSVDSSGTVTCIGTGESIITAQANDASRKTASCKIRVHTLQFYDKSEKIAVGESVINRIKNPITGPGMSGITWSSSNPNVATVDRNGNVKGVGKGTAIITARIANQKGFAISYNVTVYYKIRKNSTKFVAHAGYCEKAPANTLLAFEHAGIKGFWGAETDVKKTSDGHFILLHDKTFLNNCGVDKKPEEMTLEMIQNLRIITDIEDERAKTVPTLEQYLKVCLQYNMVPLIELKMAYDGTESHAAFLQDITEEDIKNLLRITESIMGSREYSFLCFDYPTLVKMRELLNLEAKSNVSLQFVCGGITPDAYTACKNNQIDLDMNYLCVSPSDVRALRRSGFKINLWTLNDSETAEYFLCQGVDYITTETVMY